MDLEKEIREIIERNKKVEIDKAWEISLTRKILIIILTYFLTAIVFFILGVENYLLNAFIPTIGYFLSTQSLPFIKKIWINSKYKGINND